jgi:hypothetical protein
MGALGLSLCSGICTTPAPVSKPHWMRYEVCMVRIRIDESHIPHPALGVALRFAAGCIKADAGVVPLAADDAAAHRANLDRDLDARLAGDEPDVVELVGKLAGRYLGGLDVNDAKAAAVVAGGQTHRVAGDPVAVYGTVIGKANGHCGLLRSC